MIGNEEHREGIAQTIPVFPGSPGAVARVRQRSIDRTTFLLACAIWLGCLVRIYAVTRSDFPLWDGGLFLTMTRDLEAHGFAIPLYTSFNSAHIPFAYPPLAFYLLGGAHTLSGLSLVQSFRWFPLIMSVLSIGAFIALARVLLASPPAVVAATFAFALLPDGFYLLSGGGVTRALGVFFSLLTLRSIILLFKNGERRHIFFAAGFAALALLSHLEWAFFAAYSSALFLFAYGRTRKAVLNAALVAGGAALLTAPWWLLVVHQHGIGVFFATVSGSADVFPWYAQILDLVTLHVTDEPLGGVASGLCLVGILVCLASRRRVLPIWLLAIFLLESRGSAERRLVVVAMLAGIAVEEVLLPILSGEWSPLTFARQRQRIAHTTRKLGPIVLTLTAVLGTLYATVFETTAPTAVIVTHGDRAAMDWVAVHTPPTSRVLVLTGKQWYVDDVTEWFPSLSRRVSATTVQGYEWIPGALSRQASADRAAQECVYRGSRCVERWVRRFGEHIDFVYVSRDAVNAQIVPAPPDPCSLLCASLNTNSHFRRVYKGAGAQIFRWS